jgi:Dual-action HEIGH metallo-peptidase/Bacterial pre-peptidase C-terminal domain
MMTKTKTLLVVTTLLAGCYTGMDDAELAREAEVDEIVDNLLAAGFPEAEIGVLEDGTVFVGGDAVVSLAASRELAGLLKDGEDANEQIDEFRQYRTTNLVDASVTVICVNPTAAFAANANLSAALDVAISRYNAQGLQFTMQRNGGGCSANITANMDNSGGGVAGFPSGGLPYNSITIGSTVGTYGVAVATHVIQHELGHCIGFRHTDYYNRSISCGGGAQNEGDGGVGAILIPGTPGTAVMNGSVMNSCFNDASTGVWTASDVTAVQYLYGPGGYTPPVYANIATQANQTAAVNVQTQYGPFNATGYNAMRFQIAGGTGDADLYVRFGAAPTTATYDCRPYLGGNNETCEFNPSQAGNYYVMLNAYSAYSGVTLTVDGAGAPPPAEDCDNGVDDDGDGATDCADTGCAADPVCAPAGWTELSNSTFESGWNGYVDGGTDARRLNNAAYAHSGSYTLEIRDDTTTSRVTSSAFNLTGYSQLEVDFWFYARSMEAGENFYIELWNGASWVIIANAVSGTNFNNNTLYNGVVAVDSTQVAFANNAQIRFRNDAGDDTDLINIDDVVISAQ